MHSLFTGSNTSNLAATLRRTVYSNSMSKPAFLLVGLPLLGPPGPGKVPWSDVPVSISQEIEDVTKIMHQKGYDSFTDIAVAPNEIKEKVTEKLRSRHWDAIIVGGGLKGVPAYTGALEDLVNTSKDVSPKTRIMFVTKGPMSVLEAVERYESLSAK